MWGRHTYSRAASEYSKMGFPFAASFVAGAAISRVWHKGAVDALSICDSSRICKTFFISDPLPRKNQLSSHDPVEKPSSSFSGCQVTSAEARILSPAQITYQPRSQERPRGQTVLPIVHACYSSHVSCQVAGQTPWCSPGRELTGFLLSAFQCKETWISAWPGMNPTQRDSLRHVAIPC